MPNNVTDADYAALVVNGDWTAAIQAAYDAAHDAFIPPGMYTVNGKINVTTGRIVGTPESIIHHQPPDNNTSCITVLGADAGRTILEGFKVLGGLYGQDLVKIVKGDYVTLRDLTLQDAVRDGV